MLKFLLILAYIAVSLCQPGYPSIGPSLTSPTRFGAGNSGITITNNLARAITKCNLYVNSGEVQYVPISILPGKTGSVTLDLMDALSSMNTTNNISGVLLLNEMGTFNRMGISWQIFPNQPTLNTFGLYWGSATNNTQIYLNMLNQTHDLNLTTSMLNSPSVQGWRNIIPPNNISISGSMSSDSDGTLQLVLDEYQRLPQGQYYIQSAYTGYFWKNWNIKIVYDHFSAAFSTNYKWEIQVANGGAFSSIRALGSSWAVKAAVPSSSSSTYRTQNLVGPLDDTNCLFQWDFRHLGNGLYSIKNWCVDSSFDGNNCEDPTGMNFLSCAPGRYASLTYSTSSSVNVTATSYAMRLIPVIARDLYSSDPYDTLNY